MARLSIEQQADFIDYIIRRCVMLDGQTADETSLVLTKDDMVVLDELAHRLRRMAKYEDEIRRVVTGK